MRLIASNSEDNHMSQKIVQPDQDARLAGWTLYSDPNPFILVIGPIWQRIGEGHYEYAFKVAQSHGNLYGFVHGGMIAAFADHVMGHVAFLINNEQPVATIHLDVSYLSPAKLDDLVQCRVEVVRKTRSLTFLRGDIVVDANCIATANAIWKNIRA